MVLWLISPLLVLILAVCVGGGSLLTVMIGRPLIGINFASGSATLGREHQALLGKVRTALAEFPESTVVIEGHTDSFGSDTSNQQLSQARANAVLQYLVSAGAVSPVTSTSLGYGESRPVASNETNDGRRRNRRIDIVIHPQG